MMYFNDFQIVSAVVACGHLNKVQSNLYDI